MPEICHHLKMFL